VFRVGTLSLPDAAVDLFVDRARRVRPDLVLDGATATTVAAICRKVDGLPLAIELAAARIGVLSLNEILEGLDDRFRLLRTRNPDVPARQQTMEALLEWSDRLLSDEERACLRRLGVFGAGFTVHAAEAPVAADGVDAYDVPELLWSLVDKSLVVADLTANETRYRLLESVRAFAGARLAEHGETGATAARLARWFLDRIGARRRDRGWTGETGVELDNLRALVPLLEPAEAELAQEVAVTIGRYLDAVQAYRDGIDEVTRYVADLPAPTPTRVSLLTCLADLHLRTGEMEVVDGLVAAAEALRVQVGALPDWDDVAIERIRADRACRVGDYGAAIDVAQRALAGDLSPRGRARMYSQLGIAASLAGDLTTAREALGHELAAYERLGDQVFAASAHGNLAELAIRAGDVRDAARHQRACLTLALALGAPVMIAFSLIVAARITGEAGDWATATRLHAHAESVLEATGLVLYDDDRRVSEAMVEAARLHLGEAGFVAAGEAGRALDLPAAAAIADEVLSAAAGVDSDDSALRSPIR
jgi:non-specific serine/threonine protein kinase